MGNKLYSSPTQSSFNKAVLDEIVNCAEISILESGKFNIALCGGNTPTFIYKELAKIKLDWTNWYFFWSDERFDLHNTSNQNFALAKNVLFNLIDIPDTNIFPMITSSDPAVSREQYTSLLNEHHIDLCLLGIGEDCHTASLFPGNMDHDLNCPKSVLYLNNSPKPPSKRLTLNYSKILESTKILMLANKRDKDEAIHKLINSTDTPAGYIYAAAHASLYLQDDT